MDDDFDSDDSTDSGESANSNSDVSPEKSNVFETPELRLHALAQSSYGVFDKDVNFDLHWYGFDKNGNFIYAVLCFNSKFHQQIVKYSHVTNGFYVVKRLEAGSKVLGFDEANGLFLIVELGTTPTIVLYNATSDNEIVYQCKEKYNFTSFLSEFSKALPITDRSEWLLFAFDTSYHRCYFRRVIFSKGDKYVSLSAAIVIPPNTSNVTQVFVFNKDTLIFVNTWKKVLVYNLENDQFFIEHFRVVVVPDKHKPRWNMNLTCSKAFYGFSPTYGFLKLDFLAKKWRSADNITLSVSPPDLFRPLTSGTCVKSDLNYATLAVPNNGCLCVLYWDFITKYLFEKELKTEAGVPTGFRLREYEKIIRIACFLPSEWFTLQDLCVRKLFEHFRKNGKTADKITDGEFCRQIGISSALIQTYIGTSV